MVKRLPDATNRELELINQSSLVHFFVEQLPRLSLSLVLFIGGIALLALRLPGWSLILGLPATQIGIIFLIFTFDEIAKNRFGTENLRHVSCAVCGQPTLAAPWQKEKICRECRAKMSEEIKRKKKIRSSF